MRRSWIWIVPAVVVWMLAFVTVGRAERVAQRGGGWNIPPDARTEKSPLTVNDSVVANGKKLFGSKCQRCHGASGKGDGPDADPAHADDMNLTNPARAAGNPDGVVFYKIWNGRSSPKMPTFSEELTKDQAWAIVAYVQTLRAKQ
jgi:mono/diheme cytochrome c family protein